MLAGTCICDTIRRKEPDDAMPSPLHRPAGRHASTSHAAWDSQCMETINPMKYATLLGLAILAASVAGAAADEPFNRST